MKPILIVEDEPALASALSLLCRRLNYEVETCYSGGLALQKLQENGFEAMFLDIGLPDMSGLDVLKEVRRSWPNLPVIVITAHGNLENAVAARQFGAAAYLVKPLDLGEVQRTLQQTLSTANPVEAAPQAPISLIVGAAPALQKSFVEIAHACTSDAPVLILGPTGTGKTLAARIVHANSARRDGPFVTLHCSAFPEPLLESELFGYEKNAFTGATSSRVGHIERAEGGTLFLDEIADISPGIQAKLLRFVEDRLFTRLGGREDRRVNCRLITATNKDLREEVAAKRFRADLYYRLLVLEIHLPPLRERLADLPALAAHLLKTLAPERGLHVAPETLEVLSGYDWPGNVRELRNALEHAAAVASGNMILPQHLPRGIAPVALASPENATVELGLERALASWLDQKIEAKTSYKDLHQELEGMALRYLLQRFEDKPTVLARETGMNRVTLRKKCKEIGI